MNRQRKAIALAVLLGFLIGSIFSVFVWFVNMQPTMEMAGVSKTPNQFKTDEKGTGRFTAKLETSPFGKWQALTIVEHPQIIKDTLVAELAKEGGESK
jgi:hypothetical protein